MIEASKDCSWKVYCHTNKINNKKYIGITSKPVNVRWGLSGQNYRSNKHFNNSIQKYGWENFSHDVLYDNLTKEEACQKEIELIQYYNTRNVEYGYNVYPGGDLGAIGIFNNGKSKGVNQYSLKGEYITSYKSVAEATRMTNISSSNISECCLKNILTAGNYQWRYMDDTLNVFEVKDKKDRVKIKHEIKVLQYSGDGRFIKQWNSISDACNSLGLLVSDVSWCCNGHTKTAGGFQWKKKTKNDIDCYIGDASHRIGIRINQIDKDTMEIINTYCSIGEVQRKMHASYTEIIKCCKNLRESYKGFIWKYAQ